MYKSVFCILTFFCVSTIFVTGKKGFGPGSQEYGYVEVRKGAHMFYWLYYINAVKESEATEHPLVIWLQGGPGASSTGYGNFEELGTLFKNLTERESAWTKHVNVLYIDNPVGSGFSYVENESLYVKTNHEIAVDLVTFTKEFYKKLKKFSETPLYIFAESYGGKMAIEFAYDLYQEIKNHNLKINFKGIALGDSWISPVDSCLTLAAYLLNFGEIDIEGYNTINNVAEVLKSEVESDQWSEATSTWSHLEFAVNMISGVDFFNIFYGNDHDDATLSNDIKNQNNNGKRLFLHKSSQGLRSLMDQIKNTFKLLIPSSVEWGSQSSYVFDYLREDFMKPVTNYVERVLNETNLQVVVYSGQLDLIVNTPGTLNWVQRLHWPGAEKWKMAARPALKVESKQEGFIKAYDKFTFYWINRAGHMVPKDNPYGALEMLKQITHHKT
ncbi:retinoid-inducible serine carboxypeptidase-like isoform X2 [Lycorma delicatula]|uniref:retinoid-inducible serine carboxypeptidase-like isoform X2 n=1 Tax=Lycorma delicatula TaxID=130591 RepID=UPI003F51103B